MDSDGKDDDRTSGDRNVCDESLDARLKAARTRYQDKQAPHPGGSSTTMAQGMRLGLEMVSGVIAGGAIGWFLDRWLETEPWLLILFVLLGIGAGLMNVIRASAAMSRSDNTDDDATGRPG